MTHPPGSRDPESGNFRSWAFLFALAFLAAPLTADDSGEPEGLRPSVRSLESLDLAVEGRVWGESQPLAAVSVFAYDVVSRGIERVVTDRHGRFLFSALPRSMYQIVAFKQGFAPAVEPVLPKPDERQKAVEIRLKEEKTGDVREGEDYWAVRSRIPPDIFREIQALQVGGEGALPPSTYFTGGFAAEMLAHGGVEQLGGELGEARLTTAAVDLQGSIGDLRVAVAGSYQQLAQTGGSQVPDGQVSALAVEIENAQQDSTLRLATAANQLASLHRGQVQPVDMEYVQVNWSGKTGEKGRSGVRAQYTEELGYHHPGWTRMAEIPESSRLFDVEGFYNGQLSENTRLKAGVSYRQLDGQLTSLADFAQAGELSSMPPGRAALSAADAPASGYDGLLTDEALGLYGLAGSRIRPQVLVEYGIYSTVRDGSLSLMPQGGMVVRLGDSKWKAKASVAHRLEEEGDERDFDGSLRFQSVFFNDRSSCQRAGEACYEVTFTRGKDRDDEISLGAVHRKFAETLQIYFSPDFFDRLESVFVVEGDAVPELQFRMVRRVAPRILAKLESNFAAGGGGILYATNEAMPYENEVRYLVTSLDTQFQQTSTGVFVAFHHLEQALNPVDQPSSEGGPEVEMQRLQLMLTQDLNILADVASNWAVRFNVELSRGATPYTLTNDDEISKKFTTGLSVSF